MVLSSLNQPQPATLRDQIVDQIQIMICEKYFPPGSQLREVELTKQLGVSRTPLREALILLQRDGLVVNHPNRGVFVREFDDQDIEEIFSLRVALENLAAEKVIDRLTASHFADLEHIIRQQELALDPIDRRQLGVLDRRFHYYFMELSGNSRLMTYWKGIAPQYQAAVSYRATAYPQYNEDQVLIDHRRILDTYRSGNARLVCEVNAEIIGRVAMQSTEGWRLQQLALAEEGA